MRGEAAVPLLKPSSRGARGGLVVCVFTLGTTLDGVAGRRGGTVMRSPAETIDSAYNSSSPARSHALIKCAS